MSNKEPQNQNETTEDTAVEKRRRFIKGAGAVAPIILTLASPSVFGQVLCLSQQMSGNTSGATGSCRLGLSPGFWKTPGGKTDEGVPTIDAWNKAGFVYGTPAKLEAGKKAGILEKKEEKCDSYTGGTKFSEVFGGGSTRTMREILCNPTDSENKSGAKHIIAAMLNANYYNGTYTLTPAQVKGLWDGSISLPLPFTNLKDFLDSTWPK